MLLHIPLHGIASEAFSVNLNGKQCDFVVHYNSFQDRFSFDLAINGVVKLQGRKLELGCDLVKAYRFGIGKLSLFDFVDGSNEADMVSIRSGKVRLYAVVDEK
jgi:hypothetical protein